MYLASPGVRILAFSWARPAILAAGRGKGGNVFLLSLPCHSFSFLA